VSRVWVWLLTGFRLMTWFIGLFDTALDYTLQSCYYTLTVLSSEVFTSRCSVSAFDGWRSPFSGFPNCPGASATSFSQPLNLSVSLTHWLTNSVTHQPANSIDSITFLLTTSRHRAHRKHRSITAAQLSWKHARLRIRYLATAVIQLFFRGRCLVTGLSATIVMFSPKTCEN
jgi:hypothetical protein